MAYWLKDLESDTNLEVWRYPVNCLWKIALPKCYKRYKKANQQKKFCYPATNSKTSELRLLARWQTQRLLHLMSLVCSLQNILPKKHTTKPQKHPQKHFRWHKRVCETSFPCWSYWHLLAVPLLQDLQVHHMICTKKICSLVWCKGKLTGNPCISQKNHGLPVEFPLNQSMPPPEAAEWTCSQAPTNKECASVLSGRWNSLSVAPVAGQAGPTHDIWLWIDEFWMMIIRWTLIWQCVKTNSTPGEHQNSW